MGRYTLSANERIKNSKEITTLIREGQAFFLSPFKVHYQCIEAKEVGVRVAFAVPKRKFGKAVVRNKLKRLSRESFRTHKGKLTDWGAEQKLHIDLLFMYQRTAVHSFKDIEESMEQCIHRIIEQYG